MHTQQEMLNAVTHPGFFLLTKLAGDRHSNPLEPAYTLPAYEPPVYEAPRFLRPGGTDISDIEGARSKVRQVKTTPVIRDASGVRIGGAEPSRSDRESHLSHRDIP